ncbi:MAG: adenylate cyclase, partial [Gammaproteobacteria bacterium]|nr:adenylate cyclase [Gammaproteobacteria bacterium]
VEELFRETLASFSSQQANRYLLQIKQQYHLLELKPGHVSHSSLKDLPTLIEHLGEELPGYSDLHLDRSALEGEDLALILPLGRPQCIQVFYRLNEASATAELSVLDEHNALWRQQMPYRDEQSLLTPLQRFLQSVLYRRNALLPLDNLPAHQPLEILYYQVLPDAPLRAQRLERRPPPLSPISHPFYDVQAIVEPGDGKKSPGEIFDVAKRRHAGWSPGMAGHKRTHVTLYCNHREFSELEYAGDLFAAVAQHILAQRRDSARYPCYITDLDLSAVLGEGHMQSVHYLRYKSRLEAALNQALQKA